MNILIIADAPNKIIIPKTKYDAIIALDGAADKLLANGIMPNYVVGDLDTIQTKTISILEENGIPIIKDANQNFTDFDKGIALADSLGAKSICVINSQGGRTDHTLYNIKALGKHFRQDRRIVLMKRSEYIEFLTDCNVTYKAAIGSRFAAFGMPKALVTSHGLLYELNDYDLEFGVHESCSNAFANETITLKIKGGAIIVAPLLSTIKIHHT